MSRDKASLAVLRDRIPLLQGFTDPELADFLDNTQRRKIQASNLIIGEGTLATKLYILVSGQAEVSKGESGNEEVVATLHPGATLGEMGVVDCAPRSARVIASTDCEVLELQHDYLESAPPIILGKLFRNIAVILARRVRDTNEVVRKISKKSQADIEFAAMITDIGLDDLSLPNVSARGAQFDHGNFESASFSGANLRNADLRGADFEGALFDDEPLIGSGGGTLPLRGETHSEPDISSENVRNLARTIKKP